MADSTETLFTVARDKEILTGLRSNVRAAKSDLTAIEAAMLAAKLEPDVQLATVNRRTTLSDPTPYSETITVDETAAEDAVAQPQKQPLIEERASAEAKKASH